MLDGASLRPLLCDYVALVENLLRRDLNPLEEADGYHRLIDDFSHTQEDLARVVGRSRSHVANTLRLLRLPAAVQAMLREGELTAGHARALLNAEDPAGLAHQVRAQGLNVRQTEELVQRSHAGRSEAAPVEEKDEDLQAMEQQISDYLGMKVRINMRGDRGTLNIKFRGFESLGNLLSAPTAPIHDREHCPYPGRRPILAPALATSAREIARASERLN